MQVGAGDGWAGMLIGGVFLPILLGLGGFSLWWVLRRIGQALGLGQPLARSRPGFEGLLSDICAGLVVTALCCTLAAVAGVGVLKGTVRHYPSVGTWHQAFTDVLAWLQDPRVLAAEMQRGVREQDPALVNLALRMGADAGNSEQQHSHLAQIEAPALRELLLWHGARVDGLEHQVPPLVDALQARRLELFEWLLAQGARADPDHPQVQPHLLLHMARAQPPLEDAWLQALLATPPDWNRALAGGASLLDAMVLEQLRPDWQEQLRRAGARHGVLLEHGVALPAGHPALRHVADWLEAVAQRQQYSAGQWELPTARHTGSVDPLPLRGFTLRGQVLGERALVEVRSPDPGGAFQHHVVALQLLRAEHDGSPARQLEADPQRPVDGLWRIQGFWPDSR